MFTCWEPADWRSLRLAQKPSVQPRYVPSEVLAKPGSVGPISGFAWKAPDGPELNITAGVARRFGKAKGVLAKHWARGL